MRCSWKMMFVMAVGALAAGTGLRAEDLNKLRLLQDGYPRAFFFRQSEGLAAQQKISYPQWEACFGRLMGIEGKVLDEEVPGRSARNIDFFTKFKTAHPEQLVMLHYNGNARDPRDHTEKFFAGHWLYYNGAKIVEDVPAGAGESEIKVDNPGLFLVEIGRYKNANDDIGLCILDDAGQPDWRQSEQVQLLTVDASRKVLRVRRGCYGSSPRAFQAGKAYAAAHVTEGPWGDKSNLLWFYNYSTRCPRDAQGRTCAEVLVDELAARFLPGGELAAFDGLEFDVLHHNVGGGKGKRSADCDADGRSDLGVFDGINTYGIGVLDFCRRLREKLGPNRLILADGMGLANQRAFHILNGIESEGWPDLRDSQIRDWSGGLNRQWFWGRNAAAPVFNYINHKFTAPGAKPGQVKMADVPFSTHRLVFAAAVCTDSALCYSFAPPKPADELLGIWDELQKGTEKQLGWLGQPLGPSVRLAEQQPDVLGGRGNPVRDAFLRRLSGGVQFSLDAGGVKIAAAESGASQLHFRLAGVPCNGPDLFVSVTARGTRLKDYPPEVARLMWVGIADHGGPDLAAKGGAQGDAARHMSWLSDQQFTSGFYFSEVKSRSVDVEWTIEGAEPVWISSIRVYQHPDAIYREFEHGLVLANPSPRPYTFDLERLLPGRKFRRLKGSPQQDPVANNGAPVAGKIELQPRDGIFLVKQ